MWHFDGIYADIPVEQIVAGWEKAYGEDRVNRLDQEDLKKMEGHSLSDFEREEVLNE